MSSRVATIRDVGLSRLRMVATLALAGGVGIGVGWLDVGHTTPVQGMGQSLILALSLLIGWSNAASP